VDLLLDVNIVVDLCAPRMQWFNAADEAVSRCMQNSGRVWLYVGAVQTMEYSLMRTLLDQAHLEHRDIAPRRAGYLARTILNEFSRDKHWLAALAQEGDVYRSFEPEDEQLLLALKRFDQGEIVLLTRDQRLLDIAPGWTMTPEAYLKQPLDARPRSFVDLKAQQDRIRPELEKSIHTVLHHGRYILGPEVRKLEARLGQAAEAKHAIACSSGTDALLMALMALEIGPGDAVFTTPFSFVATADVIARLGATPVFVDIDPQTYNIDSKKLFEMLECWNTGIKHDAGMPERSIGRLRPKAIIAVDLYGLPCDYDAINTVARTHGLAVIRDGAQSFGSRYKGRFFGSLADISCTSFFPTKPLGCYGDGGALFTGNDDLAHRLTSIRVHGQGKNKYDTVRLGIKGRMDTLQAAILLPKLEIFPRELEARAGLARQYAAHLENNEDVQVPVEPEDVSSAWALYTVRLPNMQYREAVQARLKENGIPSMVYYAKPLHLQPAFASLGYKPGDFPVAEECAERVLSLPFHPYFSETDIKTVLLNINL
jgi:UDP-2-acetamido-2-deoxy-ribo-hexuluronate aminotransferase